jgi:para-aminobenzoate synthetase component 1
VDDRGGADFSVAIRTATLEASGKRMSFSVGGGVTLRSDPAAEYEETLAKADSAFGALGVFSEILR